MKWFGGKAAREGARPALSRAGSGAAWGGEWPRSYEAQVREGFVGNVVAQRAVKLIAESVADAPLTASDPALTAMVTARSGGQPLLETVAAQLLLHGNAYVQVLRDAEGAAVELYALRPERVSVEVDAIGWPAAYRYAVGERVTRLPADPVRPPLIHLRSFNPVDDHYGLGCLGAAAGAVAIHNAATRWNKALLDNAARPSGALVYEPGDGSALGAEQFDRLKAEMEAGFAGAGNAGRPMLLEGGLRWQPLSLSPAEMDFVGLKAAAAREIALAFGVPPMLLGLPGDATYANYREANRALWRLTVLPLAGTILAGIAQGLSGWFADARLAVALDAVPALAEDRERLWSSVSAADFLTPAEKRAMLGIDGTNHQGSGLRRGRRGTEAAIYGHAAGERFALLTVDTAQLLSLPAGAIGRTVRVMATGSGDTAAPASAAAAVTGISVLPLAPAHLAAVASGGDLLITWSRRSRNGWPWRDGVDVPLGEEQEGYQVTLRLGDGGERVVDCQVPQLTLAAGTWGSGAVTIAVRQRGTFGLSPPATIQFSQGEQG